ncbi:MAG: transcription termination factor Rho [Acidimicrobiales bacterium]
MSAPGFDISLLEGKDRSELAAIAEQLGEKPGARAKKADIVALIMRLVGADPADAPAGDAPAAPDAPAQDEAEAPAEAEADGEAAADTAGGADEGADEPATEPAAEGSDGADGGADDGDQDHDDHGGEQGGAGNDDIEPGNRRRRRRGRDRNREDEQVQIEPVEVEGMVELRDEGYGFLRVDHWRPNREDAYVSVKQVRQFGLRTGDIVRGKSRAANRNERNPALIQVDRVNGHEAHNQPARPRFGELTPVFPTEPLGLEVADDPGNLIVRAIDLFAPLGKGSRALVAAPPHSGKTTVLKQLVRSIEVNQPDVDLFVVLLDERPEEVTDMARWVLRGVVVGSTFDRPAEDHTSVAELVIARAKRLVEQGRDVVVVLDGLTSLTRAYNATVAASGRDLGAGLDAAAIFPAKRAFGAARNTEEAGSLTVVATAAMADGSLLDEVIFEEFDGTANVQLTLDRRLAERRVVPAIDVDRSSTRHEDELRDRDTVAAADALRRRLGARRDEAGSNDAAVELLVELLGRHATNAALLGDAGRE